MPKIHLMSFICKALLQLVETDNLKVGSGYQEKYKRLINVRGGVQLHLRLKKPANFKHWDTALTYQINKY